MSVWSGKQNVYAKLEKPKQSRQQGRAAYDKNTTNHFYLNIYDSDKNEKLDWHFIDKTGAPFRSIFVVEPETKYYVKYTILVEAWNRLKEDEDWICAELEIDGRKVKRQWNKYDGKTIKGIFRYPYWSHCEFQFRERHDGTQPAASEEESRRLAEQEPKVGSICIKFYPARSYHPTREEDSRWSRKRRTMDKPPDAEAIYMDSHVKQKHMTVRTAFGPDQRDPTYFGSPPSARVTSWSAIAQSITHYETAMALYNKGWINPIIHSKWRKYLPNLPRILRSPSWDHLVRQYHEREKNSSDVCNLIDDEDNPRWYRHDQPEVKKEEVVEIQVPVVPRRKRKGSESTASSRDMKRVKYPSQDRSRQRRGASMDDEEMEETEPANDQKANKDDWTPYFYRPGVSKEDDSKREKLKKKSKEVQRMLDSNRGASIPVELSDSEEEREPTVDSHRSKKWEVVRNDPNFMTRQDSVFVTANDPPPEYIDLT